MKQVHRLLTSAAERHFEETQLLIEQLDDQSIISEPVQTGRPLGEIVLHMIRSLEFYSRGLATDHWEPLTYNLSDYESAQEINNLYNDVVKKVLTYLKEIAPDDLNVIIKNFNRSATKEEILLEMLEHSIQHRGQLLVYLRLVNVEPAKIPYIV
ncbi:MAG: DinB family protein [Candidatus Heimdallarchaeota archaeon]|nr:MAG: DinB family protein [Candidatus Heimdallarchaeota archaeon]